MNDRANHYIELLIERYPILEECKQSILDAYHLLEDCFKSGHKLLIAGNGGSSADAEHIVGELMKGFKLPRKCSQDFAARLKAVDENRGEALAEKLQGALPAISLSGHQSLNTAYINDIHEGGLYAFAQQVYGYGKEGDVLLAISTSGNSKNILNAVVVAKAIDMKVVGLTGKSGGELATKSDVVIKVSSTETFIIQELHLPIYHCLCLALEEELFGHK